MAVSSNQTINVGFTVQNNSIVANTSRISSNQIVATGFLSGPVGPKGEKGDPGQAAGNLTSSATRTSSFTAAPNTYYPVDATSGAITVTLPTSMSGQEMSIKKIDSSYNNVTLSGTINGTANTTLNLTIANQGKVIIPDGNGGWNVYAGDLSIPSLNTLYGRYVQLAADPDTIIAGTITRDANDAVTSATVAWPDGTAGTFTATTVSSAFPGAVDAYTITYGNPVRRTYTQSTVTRNTNGAVTNRPGITVS